MSSENQPNELKRVMGVPGLALSVVNCTIGAGIYALPALIGVELGPAAILGYVLTGIMFAAIVLCYVEVGSKIKTSGGSYAYVETAFGPFAGFLVNWMFLVGWGIMSDAAIMNVVADSLTLLFPVFSTPLFRSLLFVILLGLMVLINVLGSKNSLRFVEAVTLVKLIPLVGLIFFGFSFVEWANLKIDHLPSINSTSTAAIMLFMALAGFETSLNVSGEIKNPERTVPRGILLGGILVFVIYMLIQSLTQGVLGAEIGVFKDAPLAEVAGRIGGPFAVTGILLAAVVSGLGCVNGDILATPRMLYAGAKDGLFPKFLGGIHSRFGTPHLAIISYSVVIFIFSVSGGFKQLAVLASGALLLIYFAVVLAMLKLRREKVAGEKKSFTIPGGYLVPGFALITIMYVFSNLTRPEMGSIFGFVAVLSGVYFGVNIWKSKNSDQKLDGRQG